MKILETDKETNQTNEQTKNFLKKEFKIMNLIKRHTNKTSTTQHNLKPTKHTHKRETNFFKKKNHT